MIPSYNKLTVQESLKDVISKLAVYLLSLKWTCLLVQSPSCASRWERMKDFHKPLMKDRRRGSKLSKNISRTLWAASNRILILCSAEQFTAKSNVIIYLLNKERVFICHNKYIFPINCIYYAGWYIRQFT